MHMGVTSVPESHRGHHGLQFPATTLTLTFTVTQILNTELDSITTLQLTQRLCTLMLSVLLLIFELIKPLVLAVSLWFLM